MRYKHNYQLLATVLMKRSTSGEVFKVTLEIDQQGLLEVLGAKAMASKGGEARECNGDIRVRATHEGLSDVPWTESSTIHES